jgi:hypothetical protein
MNLIQEIDSVMLVWSPRRRSFLRVVLAPLANFDAWTDVFCEGDIPTTQRTYGSGRWADEDDIFRVEMAFTPGGSLSHSAEKARLSPTQHHIVLYGTTHALAFMHARGLRHGGVGPDNIFLDDNLEPHLDGFFEECLGKRTAVLELDDDVCWSRMTVRRLRSEDATDRLPLADRYEELLDECMSEIEIFRMIEVMEWLEDRAASIPRPDLGAWSEFKDRLRSLRPRPGALPDRAIVDLETAGRFNSNTALVLNECHSKDDAVGQWQN